MRRSGIEAALDLVETWESRWGEAPAPAVDSERWAAAWDEFERRMGGNFPFFHPRYAGQMLKPPHPVAAAGYVAAMLVNPNNHALDGGPVTSEMEKEAVAELAAMLGLNEPNLGHLTASGTIANLEALWVARELHPDKGVAYGANAHYTHARMCQVLRMPATAVPATPAGRIDLDALAATLARGDIGTVVLTAGTTGLGAIDPIHEAAPLAREHGVRLHVDAAYGGFFTLLDGAPAALRAIGQADSIVIDPHKHGLQPYGCGAVLFADPGVGRLYAHDSPYTYFTSDQLHLGEISLECSRAGAAAAALWLTLRAVPLKPIVTAARNAACKLAARLEQSELLQLYCAPELDIVTYFPVAATTAEIDALSAAMLRAGMDDPDDPVFLSTLKVAAETVGGDAGDDAVRILRSVLMKPEHEEVVPWLASRLEAIARASRAGARTPAGD
ncbi:MAG TPA: aminotransferase class V-fold PLP-dependent enzyme [Solirubrobacteraceae bacterium]|nr:aminotransferase class V-fold PLP-dependent enzyme [Solirubrobacteraceae bacterium]